MKRGRERERDGEGGGVMSVCIEECEVIDLTPTI